MRRKALFLPLVLVITALPALFVQARYGREAFHLFSWRAPETRELAYHNHLLTSDQWAKEIKLFHLGRLLFDRYRRGLHALADLHLARGDTPRARSSIAEPWPWTSLTKRPAGG